MTAQESTKRTYKKRGDSENYSPSSSDTIKVWVRNKRYTLKEKKGGGFIKTVEPMNHKVKYNSVRYKPGETFEGKKEILQPLIEEGIIQLAHEPKEPYEPPMLGAKKRFGHGVMLKDDFVDQVSSGNTGILKGA